MNTWQEFFTCSNLTSLAIGGIVILLIYAIQNYRKTYSFWSTRGVKGPTPLPLVGNSLTYIFNNVPKVDKFYQKKYGHIYGIYEGSDPVLHITDPEIIDKILVSDHYQFQSRGDFHAEDPLQMNNLLIMETGSDNCKKVRSTITQGLTPSRLKNYVNMLTVDKLDNFLESNIGKTVNVVDMFVLYLLDSVAQIFYGLDLNLFENQNHPIINSSLDLFVDFNARDMLLVQFKLYHLLMSSKGTVANAYVGKMVEHAIAERKNLLKNGGKAPKDFLQALIDSDLSEIQVLSNAIVMLGAGFETTTASLSFIVYELSQDPEALKIAQNEINELKTRLKSEGRDLDKITYEDLTGLKYLEACFLETNRLYPNDFRIFRCATQDTVIPNTDIKVPRGTLIRFPVQPIHQDDIIFPNASKFIPDRFLGDNKSKIKPGTYLTFGDGPRKCPGMTFATMSARAALVRILSKYEFEIDLVKTNIEFGNGQMMTQPRNVFAKVIKR